MTETTLCPARLGPQHMSCAAGERAEVVPCGLMAGRCPNGLYHEAVAVWGAAMIRLSDCSIAAPALLSIAAIVSADPSTTKPVDQPSGRARLQAALATTRSLVTKASEPTARELLAVSPQPLVFEDRRTHLGFPFRATSVNTRWSGRGLPTTCQTVAGPNLLCSGRGGRRQRMRPACEHA